MTCKDVMTADPKCCLPDDTVARAAEIMREEDVGPVPVVSDRTAQRLAGIVTDRDIAIKVVAAGRDPRSTRVDEVMSKDVITCRAEDDYGQALHAMARHQVRRIPVVNEDGALLGIISQADVARQGNEDELGEVVEEISEPTGLRTRTWVDETWTIASWRTGDRLRTEYTPDGRRLPHRRRRINVPARPQPRPDPARHRPR